MNDATCDKILNCKCDSGCIYNITCEICDCVLDGGCIIFCLECWEILTG